MHTEKVSIIIGCYNVSKWLKEKKLSCILNQTYKNIEVLLVNDGSTDDTLSICNSLQTLDKRIVVISKENGGLGSARNTGLDHASGKYIWFYDVDDEAELNLIEKNVSWMEEYQTDMNIFSYWCITPDQDLKQEIHFKERLITNNIQLKSIFVDELLLVPNGNGFAWNKFYRRSFIEKNHFRFGNQRIQQDELFNVQFYPIIDNIFISNELLYHYFIYNSGNNRSRFIENRIDIFISIYQGLKKFTKNWNLHDSRVDNYINSRLYAGVENSILYNSFHPDAPYNNAERKIVIHDILNRPEVKETMESMNIGNFSLERKLYNKAFKNNRYISIFILRLLFKYLRKFKHIIIR